MLFTLSDARNFVSNFVTSGGSCPSRQVVDDRINEAIRRLLQKADWKSTLRYVRFRTDNNCITLPRECESARLVDINSHPRRIFHLTYEFMEPGPGDCPKTCYGPDFKDLGDGYPTFFDIPDQSDENGGPFKLFAASTSPTDKDKKIKVFGKTDRHEQVLVSGAPGELLPIGCWEDGVEGNLSGYPEPLSEKTFKSIESLHLPEGRTGYVSLYAVDETTHQMYFLGKYHPDETVPGYRRYRITGHCCKDEDCVVALCKVRYIPATREDDILLVQNLDAIKNMVMAIREENSRSLDASVSYEQKAVLLLQEQIQDSERGHEGTINWVDPFSFGKGVGNIR